VNGDVIQRRRAARQLAADQLATDLIIDCERAASRRNSRNTNPERWNGTDWG
jgi:hypothetical protein